MVVPVVSLEPVPPVVVFPVVPVPVVSLDPVVPPVVAPVPVLLLLLVVVPVLPSSAAFPASLVESWGVELGFSTTLTATSTVFDPATPLMMALPTCLAVTTPLSSTVATDVSLLLHLMVAGVLEVSSMTTVASMG